MKDADDDEVEMQSENAAKTEEMKDWVGEY